jgi:dTDP-4-amino-4,6-dideoxygalactose transaminase
MMAVPFADLARGVSAMREELERAVTDALESGWFLLGERGRRFEGEFAEYCGAGHAVAVASGTDAIEVALRSLGIGSGDEVVTQANTCVPTVAAITRAGATPVLCDVEPDAGTMDPESLAGAVGPRTRAIVPVHLYGQCADMDAVAKVAGEEVQLVEDCAQAHGAEFSGRRAGTMGRVGCFSFYPTKNLGAAGDAGAVITDDSELAERVTKVRHYGQSDRYHHAMEGVNSRMDEIQAAILSAKLPRLEQWNDRRAEIASVYTSSLEGTAVRPLAQLPDRRHVFHLYVVEAPDRDRFRDDLERQGVATLIHYPVPIHRQPPYSGLGDGPVSLQNSERLADSIVSLPLFPEMTDEEVEAASAAARSAAEAQ